MPSATESLPASVPAPAPRRSERITRQPGGLWIAKPSSNSNSSRHLMCAYCVLIGHVL